MSLKSIADLVDAITYEALPANWNTFDLGRFSSDKTLWDHQQKALRSALCILSKYYEGFEDYPSGSRDAENAIHWQKRKMCEWYEEYMWPNPRERAKLNLSIHNTKFGLRELLAHYYEFDEDAPEIDFQNICNRMNFWMATGSGKTIVLVKLLELLHALVRRGEIPDCDVLFLTHREDLIEQFCSTVDEFNRAPDASVQIELKDLRAHPQAKSESPSGLLGRDHTLQVFYYRSDNLSDEHKQAIVDFRNYDNHGRWYVVLDEAHKGIAEDAKRKHIANILTRAGFLFNFSATFTDTIDRAMTVHNFNLSEFIHQGYGKHITVLNQELGAFGRRGGEDYTDEEKRKVVIKSMLLLSYTAQKVRKIREVYGQAQLYHHPMLLALVNSVDTEASDLKIYFEQILAIGRGKVSVSTWENAKDELWEELRAGPKLLYEDGRRVAVEKEDIETLSIGDVWRDVYNFQAAEGGEVEVMIRPGHHKEIAFKMKTSEHPFALIKIGDVTRWLREELSGFEIVETLGSESYFEGLNASDSKINILMGSRSFYEGWDSNRPNVINFVNIGTSNDAKKFIMQSVGRGVRIRSWYGKRCRLEKLWEEFDDADLFRKLKLAAIHPETLYVLGTNRDALHTVLGELEREKPQREKLLRLELNPDARERLLLIPEYKEAGKLLVEDKVISKFQIASEDFALLKAYSEAVASDSVLLLRHGGSPGKLKHFRASVKKSAEYYIRDTSRRYRNLDVMVGQTLNYFGIRAKELGKLCKLDLDSSIVHFKHVSADKEHASELQEIIDQVLYSRTDAAKKRAKEIGEEVGQMDLDPLERSQENSDRLKAEGLSRKRTYDDRRLVIEYLANHYYNPTIYSGENRRVDYMKHIIDEDSEERFLKDLSDYVRKSKSCVLKELDWWMFSKLDPSIDTPFIPYYDSLNNRLAKFFPDFIFWGQKGDEYTILFVDPKGMENQNWVRKVEGYIQLFEENGIAKTFETENTRVSVRLAFFTRDQHNLPGNNYQRFWMDDAEDLFNANFPNIPNNM